MNTADAQSDARADIPVPPDPVARGTLLAVVAAFFYTASIITLRHVTRPGVDWAIWVSFLKALPVVAAAAIMIARQTISGTIRWPTPQGIAWLLLIGLVMQFSGNVCFQWGLSLGGIALTVPLSQATLLISSAALGVLMINERVSRRSKTAIAVLILSICVLNIDAAAFSRSMAGRSGEGNPLLAIAMGLTAGFGWGLSGVVIRDMVTRGISVSVTIFLLSSMAIVGLGGTVLARQGIVGALAATSPEELAFTQLAGLFTAMAFFALTASLKHITIVRSSLINASQIALTSLAGFFLFGEHITSWMIVGTALTIVGLLLMDRPQPEQDRDAH